MFSYLKKLEEDSRRLQAITTHNQTPETNPTFTPFDDQETQIDAPPSLSKEESNLFNPLFDRQPEKPIHERSSEPGFIGEASCAAFSNRLLSCLDDTYTPSTAGLSNYHRMNTYGRLPADQGPEFPERMHVKLLLNVARRFIGNYHPLFLKVTFMKEIDAVYRREVVPSALWLFNLLQENQDLYEEPSLMQVEVLTLLAWASNILGRIRTAYCYSGIAMRLAQSLGMHRSASRHTTLTPVERESRRRTWWVLYFFDRFSASKLGQPITVRDDDIDVEMPSMDGLTKEEMAEFLDPQNLITNIKLAKIIGNILTHIYGIPKATNGLYIHQVHSILKQLREWHDELQPDMRVKERGTPRPVASLHLAYNQCIIQTTRPVLLHLFKTQFQLGSKVREDASPRQNVSSITLALAESCVNAAQASSRIVEGLFLDGSIATFGYWDAHHIFSAAMILIMSAVMKPTAVNSDHLETLLSVLRSLKNDGNIPAVDFCERLSDIQARVLNLRATGRLDGMSFDRPPPIIQTPSSMPKEVPQTQDQPFQTPMSMDNGSGVCESAIIGYENVDILGNPLIGSFLDGNQVQWLDVLFTEDGTLREFASEIEEPFLFR
ncbi:positive activator of transcription [Fusarium acutatum]|uniref:Positive activator of transcription n=1 Tax=Fusarium acutatum TaxID=78861 RepID=A0A8H4JJ18_9HYPO|nr:positive activator of transcription [Fusarium acutatum]